MKFYLDLGTKTYKVNCSKSIFSTIAVELYDKIAYNEIDLSELIKYLKKKYNIHIKEI